MNFRRSLSLLVLSLASSALAQTHFCIAGDLDHLNATQVTECQTKMTHMREAVRRRGAPSGWHFIVVCDEAGWRDYAKFIASHADSLEQAAFHTDSAMHLTFVRGSRMEADSADEADNLLTVALKGVPSTSPAPRAIPNPKRVLREPSLSIASVEVPHLP